MHSPLVSAALRIACDKQAYLLQVLHRYQNEYRVHHRYLLKYRASACVKLHLQRRFADQRAIRRNDQTSGDHFQQGRQACHLWVSCEAPLNSSQPFAHVQQGVRRQGFWHQRRPRLRESSAHLVGCIMRRVVCDASVAFRASYV